MKLWIDDVRTPPEGWMWAKKYGEAVAMMASQSFDEVSFDHDLGYEEAAAGLDILDVIDFKYDKVERTGYDAIRWVVIHDAWPTDACGVHSMNPVGRVAICATIERYGPYQLKEDIVYNDNGYPLAAIRYSKENNDT